jgi:hypothetical protein
VAQGDPRVVVVLVEAAAILGYPVHPDTVTDSSPTCHRGLLMASLEPVDAAPAGTTATPMAKTGIVSAATTCMVRMVAPEAMNRRDAGSVDTIRRPMGGCSGFPRSGSILDAESRLRPLGVAALSVLLSAEQAGGPRTAHSRHTGTAQAPFSLALQAVSTDRPGSCLERAVLQQAGSHGQALGSSGCHNEIRLRRPGVREGMRE